MVHGKVVYWHIVIVIICILTQTMMIGDDVVNDVGGAQSCGLFGVLVKTGKYRLDSAYYYTV